MENKNLTFEQANELLEKTVSKMESGELTLEQTRSTQKLVNSLLIV